MTWWDVTEKVPEEDGNYKVNIRLKNGNMLTKRIYFYTGNDEHPEGYWGEGDGKEPCVIAWDDEMKQRIRPYEEEDITFCELLLKMEDGNPPDRLVVFGSEYTLNLCKGGYYSRKDTELLCDLSEGIDFVDLGQYSFKAIWLDRWTLS